MKLGIVSIQKNRAPWLHEWVAFHHLVGFSTFYVFAHNCTDSSTQVLKQLAGWYDVRGFSIDTREDRVQLKVYEHALQQFGHECDWFAFIDGDEFLFPVAAPDMATALQEFDYARMSAIGAYWACFGSGGHVQEPAGLVTENYTRRAPLDFAVNHHVKSLVRGRQDSHAGANSHLFHTPWGTQDELGRPLPSAVSPHAPSHTTLPTSACCRAVSCCVRTSGNAAPMATGISLCPVSSSMRSVCCVSSSRQALPVTMVMPSTWACGDCNNASMAIWFEPPGPEPS